MRELFDYDPYATLEMCTTQAKLTKEQIDAIKEYDKLIKTIELFADSVRQNPGEYLSSIGNEGWMNAVREVIQNSTDEMNRDVSPCDHVFVEYFDKIHRCIVSDNGRALPPNDIVRVYTQAHTSTNFVKQKGVYSSGLHGVGAKCTNAVSSRFTVLSYRLGKAYKIDFSEGKPLKKYSSGPIEIPNKDDRQGLVVDFEPDFKIMKEITITCETVLDFLQNLIPLLKIGSKITFIGHKEDGSIIRQELINTEGVSAFLSKMNVKPLIKPIVYEFDNGTMKVQVAMTYEANVNKSANVLTFANMTPVNTMLSTPSKGYFQGVTQFFRSYMNKVYLANSKKKLTVVNEDVLVGLVGAVSSYHMDVMFDGQAKNVCKNLDFEEFVKHVTLDNLLQWSKKCPDDLQKVCEFIKDVATIRTKADKEKINISNKYRAKAFWDLPPGFKKAERKDHLELFIVEGLSASAPCAAGRDPLYQAIFPIRGKMLNAFSTPRAKFFENKEFQGLMAILDAGVGKSFDLNKCAYDKVIILSDADYDGFHIRVLVLKCLLMYFRPLIEDGRVYAALSPLYHVNKGKSSWSYFIDKDDFISYVRDQFVKEHTLMHQMKKVPFSKQELTSLIINNNFYADGIKKISDNYAIDVILLEDLMMLRNQSSKEIKKKIEAKYPYLKVDIKQKYPVIDGVINDKTHSFVFNENLVNACTPILPYIDRAEKRYILDGKKIGLYELLKAYQDSEPKNIERAKGLGSLNAREIGYSTLDPKRRKLIRYTPKDLELEIEEMRRVNDDQFQLIKDLDISQYEF